LLPKLSWTVNPAKIGIQSFKMAMDFGLAEVTEIVTFYNFVKPV